MRFIEDMRKYFDRQVKVKEKLHLLSAKVVRNSSRAIAALHRGEKDSFKRFFSLAKKNLKNLEKLVEKEPEISSSGSVFSARQEVAEAALLAGILDGGKLLPPEEIGVAYGPYLAALADVAGELRRVILDSLRRNQVDVAKKMLETMEKIAEIMMEFDYADSVIPGMKKRQDFVRQILEKSRGDVTVAIRQERLEKILGERK
ncbi:MAG: hypothetical protein QW179_04065 [Candidatus Hadarchaeales archaeon]